MIEEGLSDILYAWLDDLSFDNTSNPKKEYCDKNPDAIIIIVNNKRIHRRLIKQKIMLIFLFLNHIAILALIFLRLAIVSGIKT